MQSLYCVTLYTELRLPSDKSVRTEYWVLRSDGSYEISDSCWIPVWYSVSREWNM